MFPVNITKFLRTLFWRTSENGCFEFNMYYINIRLKRQFISKLSITLLTNYRNIWSKYFVYTHTTFLWRVAAYFIRRYVHQMYLLSQNYQGYRSNILFVVFNDAKGDRLFVNAKLKREFTETIAQRCSVKKVFLEISSSSQENTFARASF